MDFLFNCWPETYPQKIGKLIHEELSRKILGAAMDVLNEIKPGLDEKLSQRALAIELRKRGHAVESQKRFPVSYQNDLVGNLTPDLIVDEKVIVDFRVVAAFNDAHVAQMVGYLAITGLELALLLNLEARCATAKPAIFSARPSDLKPLIRAMSVIRG